MCFDLAPRKVKEDADVFAREGVKYFDPSPGVWRVFGHLLHERFKHNLRLVRTRPIKVRYGSHIVHNHTW